MANRANIAATNMEHLCNCDLHGYSQGERWGDPSHGICYVECEGHTSTFYAGDRDCSSAIIDSWQEALIGTPYEGSLGGASYTGNMLDAFVSSGLFEWHDMSFTATRGDIYLNIQDHTAMCLDAGWEGHYDYDCLGEFSLSETGGIYGQWGDQTGGESNIHGYYDYPWDGILHYNGGADGDYAPQPAPEPVPDPIPTRNDRLHIIDIASWQEGIIPSQTNADAVIIKVTGGTHYENPFWRQWADDVLASGKLLGLYHYAVESEDNPDPRAEAEFFLSKVGDYVGRFIPVLDWEADALNLPQSWAREWLDIVAERTGATPWFYGYASNINSTDYSSVAEKYPLWIASYLNRYDGAGFEDDPEQTWGYGNWNYAIAYQYTSTGYISGYGAGLDLSVGYMSAQDWSDMCGGYSPQPRPQPSGNQPKYAVYTNQDGWLDTMEGLVDTGGSSDDYAGVIGNSCTYIGINGVGQYRVYSQASGWLPYVDHFNSNDEEYGMAGDGSAILALEIPNDSIKYQVHVVGDGWYSWMIGNRDTGGSSDTYAGDMRNPIDAIRITLA